MALDYLPIQASAVPCERVFSSSAETDTKRRNRIHSVLMEALQMLKFSLKTKRLNFTQGLSTPESDMLVPADDEADVLAQAIDTIDRVLAVIGQDDLDNV